MGLWGDLVYTGCWDAFFGCLGAFWVRTCLRIDVNMQMGVLFTGNFVGR